MKERSGIAIIRKSGLFTEKPKILPKLTKEQREKVLDYWKIFNKNQNRQIDWETLNVR